ncbi:VOC family protein [Actinosynnema pretiosum]|nr:VOC family protein [Actinosynnema pretiosum]
MPTPTTRGLRRLELSASRPESAMNFYAELFGWVVIAEPGDAYSGWAGDRLATRITPGQDPTWRVTFAAKQPRVIDAHTDTDTGRPLHGPWAPPPRPGEPCWVELVNPERDDAHWTAELGWTSRTPDEDFTLYDSTTAQPRAVTGRLRTDQALPSGWLTYFAVPDLAAALATANGLGASTVAGPRRVPTGHVAAIAGPDERICALLEAPAGWGGEHHRAD